MNRVRVSSDLVLIGQNGKNGVIVLPRVMAESADAHVVVCLVLDVRVVKPMRLT